MLAAWKFAASSSTVLVCSLTSLIAPPITPAIAVGPSGSVMSSISLVSVPLHPVERRHLLALVSAAHNNVMLAHQVIVERMQGLAELRA